jgi:ribosome biogenesis GTPase A
MIIGIPNVGKSSLINMLRAKNLKKGRVLKVGPSAGVTKCVHEKVRISADPPIFLFDTPGILTPRIDGDETGMKLAVCCKNNL